MHAKVSMSEYEQGLAIVPSAGSPFLPIAVLLAVAFLHIIRLCHIKLKCCVWSSFWYRFDSDHERPTGFTSKYIIMTTNSFSSSTHGGPVPIGYVQASLFTIMDMSPVSMHTAAINLLFY